MEHQLLPILSEIPPTVPIINGDPMYPMENYLLDPNAMAAYSNYPQIMTQPKMYNTWPSCPQYWPQIVFVQVNPGEILTIKADDGSIQNIQGPADIPLIVPANNLPPIYVPPGYITQVVEENGIQKIIVMPQTLDYQMPVVAPAQQPFTAAPPLTYPSAPQLLYSPAQGDFPITYIQESVPQQMPPPPPLPPLPMLPPPPPFIYQEHLETYSHERVNHNQFDEKTVKMGEYSKKKMRDCQFDEHKTSSLFKDAPLLLNKAVDMPGTSAALFPCTVDTAPGTHTDNKITSSSDHAPSTSTSNTTFCSDVMNSAPGPSRSNYNPVTSDGTHKSSTTDSIPSYASKAACNAFTSENAHTSSSINKTLRPSGSASISNNTWSYTGNTHEKRENNMGSGDNKQNSGGKQKIQSSNSALKEHNTKYRIQPCSFNIEKPVVSNIQTRSAIISWSLNSTEKYDINSPMIFELALSSSGKNGIYKNIYTGGGVTVALRDLQPCMLYFLRVTTIRGTEHRSVSEVVSFTTPGCEPDPPLAPKLINRTKNSLNLQWKGSNDNGSKISSFLLEWDEGKGEDFKSCYSGPMKQHKIIKLRASTKYSFRLAAKNNFGCSNFSEIAVFYTSGNTPPTPLPPKLKEAGVYSLSLEWCAPKNLSPNDIVTYVLEMDEAKYGLGFKPKYNGEDLCCTVRNLQRNTTYKFRIFAYNLEGRSNSSGEVRYSTRPASPGCPKKPYVMGAIQARQVKIGWDSPKDNGGMNISSYSLEVSENSNGANLWNIIYNGTLQEFLYDDLQPGTTYKLRVFCTSSIGQSQPSEVLTIQTPTLPPESCRSLSLNGKTKGKNNNLLLDKRSANGNLETPLRGKKSKGPRNDRKECPNSEKKCALGSQAMKCGTVQAWHPPSRCGTPVLTCKAPTCVIVSWEIPKCNGSEITDYRLQWGQVEDSMNLIYTGPCLSYEVKGLIPATTYFCRVQAVNIVGVGMFGGTGKITTPGTVPAVVPMLQEVENKLPAKLSSTCLAIQWEEPDCHGSPITGYNIEYGDKKILTVKTVTEHVLKNLQPNTTYRIRIQAINHYGLGPFSPPIRSKTKPLPPDPPPLNCAVYRHQSLRLKWGTSSSKKPLANFISYNLFMEDRYGRFSVIYQGSDLNHKVQKLSEYTQYKFKIQACNEAGEGPESDIYTFTTTKTPPPALKAPKFHVLHNNSCEIKWESLQPMKGDPIVYCLQVTNGKKTEQIYKGPNTSFTFSNYLANSRYRFKVCAGRQYEYSNGMQELWGPYSPSTLFSTYKHHSKNGKGSGGKGKGNHNEKDEKYKTEISDDTFVLILLIGFALIAILCAVAIQYFLIN
ncbi:fibronectin type III domain containing protein 3C1-like [Psammomys obesus]|uniref:fibronectin type III domain containing protein 3C1-like n=1 Tax=Psammomys obesus TaxID=48139 RepID=UPI002452FBF7|nr:fibronectin type III domain containing protein 3C1-like [Psammomys obesus]